jgi:hypothetical protein
VIILKNNISKKVFKFGKTIATAALQRIKDGRLLINKSSPQTPTAGRI